MNVLHLPPDALVLLIGVAGSGKSTLATRLFEPAAILASDDYRAAVSPSADPADQSVTRHAFARLHADLERRLAAGQLTVVDATNVQGWARRRLLAAAARHGRPAFAIVVAIPLDVSLARNAGRVGRPVPSAVVRRQDAFLRRALPRLESEGYGSIVVLATPDQADHLSVRTDPDATKRPEGTAPDPLMQSPESSPGP